MQIFRYLPGKIWRFPRPSRRLLLFVFIFLTLYLSGSLYRHIVDFYFPSLTIPVKQDMSKYPVLKDQAMFLQYVIQPMAVDDGLLILVLISSGASGENHFQKRMAIRNTWGKKDHHVTQTQWRVVFFLGKTHKPSVDSRRVQEARKFRDMIIGDFSDTYRNITKKLMMAFKWASSQKYEYLLKTDDDVYINIPSLIQWIITRPFPKKPLYAGILYRANVVRDKTHRHYVSWHDLPQKRYPWYPKGALYVLSGEIVKQMVEISSRVKQITVDDAYVGILASNLGVQPIRLHGFIQWGFMPVLLERFDQCTYMNIFGMADSLSPKDMYFVHQEVIFYQNSSKWMCIHVYHPVFFTGTVVILAILFLYFWIRRSILTRSGR